MHFTDAVEALFLLTLNILKAQLFERVVNYNFWLIYDFAKVAVFFAFCLFLGKLAQRLTANLYLETKEEDDDRLNRLSLFFLLTALSFGNSDILLFEVSEFDWVVMNRIYLITFMIIFIFIIYYRYSLLKEKHAMELKKEQAEQLHIYTENIESQLSEIRKFKHDYDNFIIAMDGFLREEDYLGLSHYYENKVRTLGIFVMEDLFQLEPLANLKIVELKSIIALKLMLAQHQGFDVSFELSEPVMTLNIDPFVLVRALGIALDNALEELRRIKTGCLKVAIFKSGQYTNFIVSNTCGTDLPPLHELKAEGFSTKGENRGIGLSLLSEFSKTYEQLLIKTTITDTCFIQELQIRGAKI